MPDLKLLALDKEDLEVVSAYTQDAVLRVNDMGFVKSDKRFALVMNRYVWEEGDPKNKGLRRRAAMHFDHVLEVKSKGINLESQEGVLDLLSITFEETDAPSGVVTLSFAGGGTVELVVECLELRLSDLGASWAAKATPKHETN
ncbi:MAG: DUF2948 family protein [Devosiaceae bacterium]|nr:DUF2948 family protein [Devosiaceae bacterium]